MLSHGRHLHPPAAPEPRFDIRAECRAIEDAAERWDAAGYVWMAQGLRAIVQLRRGEK